MTSAMHILRKWEQEKSRKLYTRDVSSGFVCFTFGLFSIIHRFIFFCPAATITSQKQVGTTRIELFRSFKRDEKQVDFIFQGKFCCSKIGSSFNHY
jgi:hypothetical protein